jgi:cytoplasmic iron level regulating protein YaaA (DUF328/UPF0246 family)
MLLLISPAKTLDYETPVPSALMKKATVPQFAERSAQLIEVLRQQTAAQIGELMAISPALAELNVERYAAWSPQFDKTNSRPAALAFNGDVYDGLAARELKTIDLNWAQQHLVILSGLYGALRPLDLLQPYRLEMGTRLANPGGRDLYAFWGDTVAEYLLERLDDDPHPVIVNLASQEYFKVVQRPALTARVIECVFEDWKGGQYKVISFFAKRARGLMARHAVLSRAKTPSVLKKFATDGYAYDAGASEPDRWVFRRRMA